MKLLTLIIVAIFALGAAPAPTPIGEKEIDAAVKAWVKAPARETEAAKAQRQQAVIDGLVGKQLLFAGKLGKEAANKSGGIDIEVVDESSARLIVISKTKDATTGVKIGGKITIGGEITKVTIRTDILMDSGRTGEMMKAPPRIDITVK